MSFPGRDKYLFIGVKNLVEVVHLLILRLDRKDYNLFLNPFYKEKDIE
jgi:hypothetical protein